MGSFTELSGGNMEKLDKYRTIVQFFNELDKPIWTPENVKAYNEENETDYSKSKLISIYYRYKDQLTTEQQQSQKTTQGADGSIVSDVVLRNVGKKNMTPQELLRLHSFDPDLFVITRVVSNTWTTSTSDSQLYNFQSKITVAPIVKEFDIETAINKQLNRVKPFEIETPPEKHGDPLTVVINVSDTHFSGAGVDYDDNLGTLALKMARLQKTYSKSPITIVLNMLGDIVNVDTIKGQTTKGTQLQTFDIEEQLNETIKFTEKLFSIISLVASNIKVQGVYGNHDTTLSYYIYRLMEQRYNKVATFDITKKDSTGGMFKSMLINGVMIGATHGDKRGNNIPMLMATEFPKQWAGAKTREMYCGHIHTQKTKIIETQQDVTGMVIRQVPTAKPVDDWEKSKGFTSAKKRFLGAVYRNGETEQVFYW